MGVTFTKKKLLAIEISKMGPGHPVHYSVKKKAHVSHFGPFSNVDFLRQFLNQMGSALA